MLGSNHSLLVAKRVKNKFWSEIIQHWARLLSRIPVNTSQEILSSTIWSNPSISKVNLSLSNWYSKGIIIISDLVDSKGNFYTQQTLKLAFGIHTNFLEYHRVTMNIKEYLKKLKVTNLNMIHQKPIYHAHIRLLQSSNKGTRDFYNILCSSKYKVETPIVYSFWEQALKLKLSGEMWKHIYRVCFNSIKDNTIIWLQYRILNRILGTNEYLYKIKKQENSLCSICKHFPETILHLFTECDKVKQFWSSLELVVKMKLNLCLKTDPPSIIFGNINPRKSDHFSNIIYLTAKMYIFKNSRSNVKIIVDDFIKYLGRIYTEYECVAKLESKHTTFLKVWSGIRTLIS